LTDLPDDEKPDDAWRSLDAPFLTRDEWSPISGTCSRCGGRSWLGTTKWWHAKGHCPSRGPGAEFLPDKP
jgi:hypothetical protein